MVESADSVLDEAAVLPPVGSCIEPSNLALAIFGAIFGTLLLCTAFALLIWYLMRTDKLQIADKLLVLERGLLRKRGGDGGGGKEEAAVAKRTDVRGAAEGTKRETEMAAAATAAVGQQQMDGMTTELQKGCRQLEMNIGVGGGWKEGRKWEDKKEKPNNGEEEEETAQKAADRTEEKKVEEEKEEEAKTEAAEEPKKKQRTKVEGRKGREEEEEEEAKNARGAAAPEEEKPTDNAADDEEPQQTNGHRFRQSCGGQPVEQNNNNSKRESGGNDDGAAERLGEEGGPVDNEAEEGQKHSARLMTMLSAEQFGTLELNRRRLETERRQLREMGVI